jgi:hypothetical protein
LWRLFDIVPGLDFLHLDTKSRLVRSTVTAYDDALISHAENISNTMEYVMCGFC